MSPHSLPAGWAQTTLGDACTVVGGGTPNTKDPASWGEDVAWLTPADLSGYTGVRISQGARGLSQHGLETSGARVLPQGSVLFSSRAPIGHVAIASGPIATNQGFKSVVPPTGITSEYLYWYLRWMTPTIKELGSGTTFAEVSGATMSRVPLLLPPTTEQRRLTGELERRLSHFEATERSLRSSMRKLETAEGALVELALSGRLLESICPDGDAEREASRLVEKVADLSPRARWRVVSPAKLDPEREGGWPTVALGRLAQDAGYGTSEKTSLTAEGVAVLRIPNIRRRAIDLTELKYLAADKVSTEQRLAEGDVLFIRSNGSPSLIGVAAAVTPAAAGHTFASYLIRFRMGDPLLARWVELVASAPSRRRWLITQSSSSAGQHNLGQPDIAALPIPVPAREDMERVLREFDRRQSLVTAARRTCEQQLARCEQARRAVLTWAFTGRLVEQHPDEEPAQRLLERIAADRAANPTPKRSRTARTSKEKSA